MRKMLVVVSLCILLVNCNEGNGASEAPVATDTSVSEKRVQADTGSIAVKDTAKVPAEILPASSDIEKKILGVWARPGAENANFVIQKKKIFYPDHNKSYPYTIVNERIKIKYDDYTDSFLIKLQGADTLILAGETDHTYYRFKN